MRTHKFTCIEGSIKFYQVKYRLLEGGKKESTFIPTSEHKQHKREAIFGILKNRYLFSEKSI